MINCKSCGSKVNVGGKLWCGPIKNQKFMDGVMTRIAGSGDKMNQKSVQLALRLCEELPIVGYYSVPKLTRALGRSSVGPEALIQRLKARDFKAGRTHFNPNGIKTDAGIKEIKSALASLKHSSKV
jgi:tRNA (guanine26-N2/guanine27-N2)-dimethyltransferase